MTILWNPTRKLTPFAFEKEDDLEEAIEVVAPELFGPRRWYLNVKRRIGKPGGLQNIPDGYLLDLTSDREPVIYVVEVELSSHPLKHIAMQILEFSLSFEDSPLKVRDIIRETLASAPEAFEAATRYAREKGFDNIDRLLEKAIYSDQGYRALVVIDEVSEELERALLRRFRFPVEVISLERYQDEVGETLYSFEPFLADVGQVSAAGGARTVDPSEIDTIVVPARDDGFVETFLGENCWYQIRIHSSMIPMIRHVAAYRVSPTSAITHVAPVSAIEPYRESGKYILRFSEPAREIGPIKLVPGGRVKAPQGPRYTSLDRLTSAKTLEEAF